MKLVSVIITTSNRANLLCRAIESVINQTYKNLEIIVVDDASKDNTYQVVKSYMAKDSRVAYIKNDKPSGANVSRNKGIKQAKGFFIAGLDDDDEFLPNRIELLVKNYDPAFSYITSNNILLFPHKVKQTNIAPKLDLNDMLVNNKAYNQGLIEKQRLREVGLYDKKLLACQDYDMWMRLILKYGPIKVIKEVTQKIYFDDTIKRISTNSKRKYYGYFGFYKKYKHLLTHYARVQHLLRIYDIRTNAKTPNKLALKLMEKKILALGVDEIDVYGAGVFLEQLYEVLQKHSITIRYIFDTNAKSNQKFFGINVLPPQKLQEVHVKNIAIASVKFFPQIKETILYYTPKSNIISL